MSFKLHSEYKPQGDQPKAIDELTEGILRGDRCQTLLGVTGSGKTFTMANVIERLNRPTLVISHNKTLAAQLYGEFQGYFPENAVEYFVSYYDYYQPEAYKAASDTYIEKEIDINEEIDRLRLKALSSLLERKDVIIVATVSCIYGIGSPKEFEAKKLTVKVGDQVERDDVLRQLIDIFYTRNDLELKRGCFRVRGDVIEVVPAAEDLAIRIEMFGDEVEQISILESVSGKLVETRKGVTLYPAKAYITDDDKIERACEGILMELEGRRLDLQENDKLVEAHRIETRTKYDVEMIKEVGYCPGIENYSRYMDHREVGAPPYVLMDYFGDDYLLMVDESHMTIPQVRGMWRGDRSRKDMLVEHGFRLPSAYDNRPLYFDEFEQHMGQTVFVSATPAAYELERSGGVVVEQVIRPTGLIDPQIDVRPLGNQVDDLMGEIRPRAERGERILATVLTKRMAEKLTDYLGQMGFRVRYLHSEIDTLDRVAILRDLRLGEFDVLVGINLLREGLDLPEVSLVAILDADKEGFLRSEQALTQTVGRAARNSAGLVIFYADKMTNSMRRTIDETTRRRSVQEQYNEEHGITPQTILRTREEIIQQTSVLESVRRVDPYAEAPAIDVDAVVAENAVADVLADLQAQMNEAAAALDFERAAQLRDEITRLHEAEGNKKAG
ncbi:MAG: excinuclease ABC subunit UvrB [Gemmatimonadetes bacterium]|nr:excinuclease ABC subunit UvrB [Gemmatimonadota bacterium]MBT4610070.1 excinuclease ABC subunit UvrB [Gemmatimonadota bacterium]MBT5055716.1 excinuclease ABC subunit UvrB [Gemmatimonadota bacterium]MBT5143879.1 excinuclease ABC subunit UvrB [Gemmatimonadota bacterium]MBT5589059.1 excinuclease ABC subunit UvrB [Gemmatimonadota bacterium]